MRMILILLGIMVTMLPASEAPTPWGNTLHRNMRLDVNNLPSEIGPDNLLWEIELSGGRVFNQPTVVNGRVYLAMDTKSLPERVRSRGGGMICADVATGELVWQGEVSTSSGGYGVGDAPLFHDGRIYLRAETELVCLDAATGEQIWSNGAHVMQWFHSMHDACGTGLIVGEQWWIPTGYASGSDDHDWHANAFERPWHPNVVVVDINTGELLAQDNVEVGPFQHGQWSSLSAAEINGQLQVFYGDSFGYLHAFAAPAPVPSESGKPGTLERVWWMDANPHDYRYDEEGRRLPYMKYGGGGLLARIGPLEIVSAPVYFDGKLYLTLCRDVHYSNKGEGEDRHRYIGNGALVCVDPTGSGDVTDSHKVWIQRDLNRTFSTPSISDEGLLYVSDHAGWLSCFDVHQEGALLWRGDIHSNMWNWSQILADDKIYVCNERKDFFVFEADRDGGQLFHTELDRPNNPPVGAMDGVLFVACSTSLRAYGTR